jgi:hypothetical protein
LKPSLPARLKKGVKRSTITLTAPNGSRSSSSTRVVVGWRRPGREPYDRRVPRPVTGLALVALVAGGFAAVSVTPSPAAAATRCTATADFDVHAIPSGYEDGTADVLVKGVPRSAKRIRVRFVHAASGRPVGRDAFPLQRWSSSVKGFRRDGALGVQIRLDGSGYGMPAARSSRWRVVVSYDC